MKFSVIGDVGAGKTLYSVSYAYDYTQRTGNPIFSNFHIELENAHYKPFMYLRLNQLENCLIIIDDVAAFPSQNYFYIMVQLSRKNNVEIILTFQYYTMLEKKIRNLTRMVFPEFWKKEQRLFVEIISNYESQKEEHEYYEVLNIERFYNIYKTNETVPFCLESDLIRKILETAENQRELEIFLSQTFKSQAKVRKYMKMYKDEFPKNEEYEELFNSGGSS